MTVPSAMPGDITLEPLVLARDVVLLHEWVTHPRSVFWMMQEASLDDVLRDYADVVEHPHHDAWLGRVGGRPTFLAETYDPDRAPHVGLAGLPEIAEGDVGMHLLVAPPRDGTPPEHGLTRRIFAAVLARCFADPAVRRVVVEPDVENAKIATINAEAGFVVAREIDLPGKRAALSFCTREAYAARLVVP
ncbi:GNAT family N-acetyltransferase [Nocardioides sp. R-C-SC26]|uniref:GNAT family N-acetyltransferase n=1 Tax=Nocardioides sp. R-C-SC26 TaxID=2870414 RepID=UPI001E458130|nr:GNAT family N-acetyltransferase [Nocardioides sp. R-C-SC26]